MTKFSIFSLLLIGSGLSLLGQQTPDIEATTENLKVVRSKGIASFDPNNTNAFPDSIVKFIFDGGHTASNTSKTVYFYNSNRQLDSIHETFQDNYLQYFSGHSTTFFYDEYDRISSALKASWNSQIRDLIITIYEDYDYADNGDYLRYSHIAWSFTADTSVVPVKEQYNYDDRNNLVAYTMHVPVEINPDSVTYKETYQYDSLGSLVHELKSMYIKDEIIQQSAKKYTIQYNSQNLPDNIYTYEKKNGEIEWTEISIEEYLYDLSGKKPIKIERHINDTVTTLKNELFIYDKYGRLINQMSYILDTSGEYILTDSTVHFYSWSETEPLILTLESTNISEAGKNDASISATVTGGLKPYTYNWSNGDTSALIELLNPGIYYLTVTDAFGESISDSIVVYDTLGTILADTSVISEKDPIVADVIVRQISCFGANDGSITFLITGGTGHYSIRCEEFADIDFMQMGPGTYHISIIDSEGVEKQLDPIKIFEPDSLVLDQIIYHPVCSGDENGSIEIDIIGGTKPYTVEWSNMDSDTEVLENLSAGKYEVKIIDKNLCTKNKTFILTDPDKVVTGNIVIEDQYSLSKLATYSVPNEPGSVYHWNAFGGKVTEGQGTNTVQVEWNGVNESYLKVVEENSEGCFGEISKIDGQIAVSNEEISKTEVNIFPNPTKQNINIEGIQQSTLVSIYDACGQLIILKNIDPIKNNIDVLSLTSGIYILKLNIDNELIIKRFVKN